MLKDGQISFTALAMAATSPLCKAAKHVASGRLQPKGKVQKESHTKARIED